MLDRLDHSHVILLLLFQLLADSLTYNLFVLMAKSSIVVTVLSTGFYLSLALSMVIPDHPPRKNEVSYQPVFIPISRSFDISTLSDVAFLCYSPLI